MRRDTGHAAVLERAPRRGRTSPDDDLRAALVAGDLTVHLQPQVALDDGRTVGVEALLRWEHPSRGVLAPDVRSVAGRAGLRGPLVETVLDLALAGVARWWSGRAPLPVSVNLAARDVVDPALATTVAAALARHGLPPRALVVEVVADAVTVGGRRAHAVLSHLRALGIAVSVDGCGTDHGLLAGPGRLSVDEIKLHPGLVADVATDARAAAVARHTAALAHSLGLRVVADGVGDTATLDALTVLGCDAVQGAVVAPPMPVDGFVHWVRVRSADLPVRYDGVPQQRPASLPG